MIEHSHNVAHYGMRVALVIAIWCVIAVVVGIPLGKCIKRMRDG